MNELYIAALNATSGGTRMGALHAPGCSRNGARADALTIMKRNASIFTLTLGHAAMGATLGAACALAMTLLELHGFRPLASPMLEGSTLAVILLSLSSWIAVGAGLSGFLLINVERAGQRPAVRFR